MLVVQTGSARAARKMSILMAVVCAFSHWLGAFTLHTYVRRKPLPPPGFRIFGFPRPRRDE